MSEPLIVGKLYKKKSQYESFQVGERYVCYREIAPYYDWELGPDGKMHLAEHRRWEVIRVSDLVANSGVGAKIFEDCLHQDASLAAETIKGYEENQQRNALRDEINLLRNQYHEQLASARAFQIQLVEQTEKMAKTQLRLKEIEDMGIKSLAYMFDK